MTVTQFINTLSASTKINAKGMDIATICFNYLTIVEGKPEIATAQVIINAFSNQNMEVINRIYSAAIAHNPYLAKNNK